MKTRGKRVSITAVVMDSDSRCSKVLRKMSSECDHFRLIIQKNYGSSAKYRHPKPPPMHDDIDKFLWAYEKRMNANLTVWAKLIGLQAKVPTKPPTAEELLMDQNIKLVTLDASAA